MYQETWNSCSLAIAVRWLRFHPLLHSRLWVLLGVANGPSLCGWDSSWPWWEACDSHDAFPQSLPGLFLAPTPCVCYLAASLIFEFLDCEYCLLRFAPLQRHGWSEKPHVVLLLHVILIPHFVLSKLTQEQKTKHGMFSLIRRS